MVLNEQVENVEALIGKVIPLLFAVPLMLRILPQTPNFIQPYLAFSLESFFYSIILITMGLISLAEMHFARTSSGGTILDSLGAGAIIMMLLGITGLVLGVYVIATDYTFTNNGNNLDLIGKIIAYYMFVEVFILVISARKELREGIRLGVSLRGIHL